MQPNSEDKGLAWQIGVWDRMAQPYQREVDRRLTSVVDGVMQRARLQAGEQVLDLGTGTGAAAIRAASLAREAGSLRRYGPDLRTVTSSGFNKPRAALRLRHRPFSPL